MSHVGITFARIPLNPNSHFGHIPGPCCLKISGLGFKVLKERDPCDNTCRIKRERERH